MFRINNDWLYKSFLSLLKHPLFITVIAGVITCFVGQRISSFYQIKQLHYQQEFEVFKERYNGSLELLDDISLAASKRIMGMNRLLWVIKETSKGDLETTWDEYYKTVLDWNINQIVYETKIMQYIGDKSVADSLMNNNNSSAVQCQHKDPNTLHGHFLRGHDIIKQLYACAKVKCASEGILIDKTQIEILALGSALEEFHNEYVGRVNKMAREGQFDMFCLKGK